MFKGWKTIAINFVTALVSVLELTQVIDLVPEEYSMHYALALAASNLILRMVTTTPVGKSE